MLIDLIDQQARGNIWAINETSRATSVGSTVSSSSLALRINLIQLKEGIKVEASLTLLSTAVEECNMAGKAAWSHIERSFRSSEGYIKVSYINEREVLETRHKTNDRQDKIKEPDVSATPSV